jgi:hypothetical protein
VIVKQDFYKRPANHYSGVGKIVTGKSVTHLLYLGLLVDRVARGTAVATGFRRGRDSTGSCSKTISNIIRGSPLLLLH